MIVEEHLRGKWREIGRDQSTNAFWKRRDLKAYTSYRISVIACNKLNVDDNGKGIEHMACTARGAVIQFRTKVGRPGRPNEPVATFKNSSIVELNWDEDFQVCTSILGKMPLYNEPPAGGREGGALGSQGVQGRTAVGYGPKEHHQRGGCNLLILV